MSEPRAAEESPALASWHDLFGVLVGRHSSIVRFTCSQHGLRIGALLVASAALAREYDAVSFLHQPLDLLAPFAASLSLATILFFPLVLFVVPRTEEAGFQFLKKYRLFLLGYWSTAPLAWLYAIPVEGFFDELNAVRINLSLLAIVSLWRVFLFPRIVAVIFGIPYWIALAWTALPCVVIAGIGLIKMQIELVGIMGGLRLSQTEEIVRAFSDGALQFLGIAFWVSAALWFVSLFFIKRYCQAGETLVPRLGDYQVGKSVWFVVGLALALLLALAMSFQIPLFRAAVIDRLLTRGEFELALQKMNQFGEAGFPRDWDPLPRRREYPSEAVELVNIVQALQQHPQVDPWVRRRMLTSAPDLMIDSMHLMWFKDFAELAKEGLQLEGDERERFASLLGKLEELSAFLEGSDQENLRYLREALNRSEPEVHTSEPEPLENLATP
jgi:hypothetical protein